MISPLDLYWLAGLLEGEGSFLKPTPSHPNQLRISLQMTDEDVVAKAAQLFENKYHAVTPKNPKHKTVFVLNVRGKQAIEWMLMLRPLMGNRRVEQIDKALASYDPDLRSRSHVNQRILTDLAVEEAKKNISIGVSLRSEAKRLGVHHESLRRRLSLCR